MRRSKKAAQFYEKKLCYSPDDNQSVEKKLLGIYNILFIASDLNDETNYLQKINQLSYSLRIDAQEDNTSIVSTRNSNLHAKASVSGSHKRSDFLKSYPSQTGNQRVHNNSSTNHALQTHNPNSNSVNNGTKRNHRK